MLTSFFGNSRPVNFLLLAAFILIGYTVSVFFGSEIQIDLQSVSAHLILSTISVFSMLLLNFIVTKNKLTKLNTLAVLFYSSFMVMLPVIFVEDNIVVANFFLLLAFRRIVSLRKDTNSSKKILDASVWITVASLFYFWSFLFFIPLWIAIIQKPNTSFKQVLIPITGFLAVILINTAFQLLVNNSIAWLFEWKDSISLDFSIYNNAKTLLPATVIIGFFIWTGIWKLFMLPTIPFNERSSYLLTLYIGAISFVIALAAPEKTGAELLFVLAPLSIITTNYFEKKSKKHDALEFWFKEILLWMVVVFACVFLFGVVFE